LILPAQLSQQQTAVVRDLSIRAFQAIGCSGMARVDLFIDKNTDEIYVNEINTIPGFTNISMYPKLWEITGWSFSRVLNELLELGLERSREQSELTTSYDLIENP
jgi:D-alanine-D-alanine ligase